MCMLKEDPSIDCSFQGITHISEKITRYNVLLTVNIGHVVFSSCTESLIAIFNQRKKADDIITFANF